MSGSSSRFNRDPSPTLPQQLRLECPRPTDNRRAPSGRGRGGCPNAVRRPTAPPPPSSGTGPVRAGRWSTGSRKQGRPPREASVRCSSLPGLLGSCHARASTTVVAVGSSVTTPIDAPAGGHRERRQWGEQLEPELAVSCALCRERVEEPQRLVAGLHLQDGLGPTARRGADAGRHQLKLLLGRTIVERGEIVGDPLVGFRPVNVVECGPSRRGRRRRCSAAAVAARPGRSSGG